MMDTPDAPDSRFGDVATASIAQVMRDMRAGGEIVWPWPPSLAIDDPDINIETCLVAAMNYLKTVAASGMPRGEQDRFSLKITYGLIENGLRLSRARREGAEKQ